MENKMRITTKKILKEINCKYLSLHNGGGYFYFVYDNEDDISTYNTKTVITYRLNDLFFGDWIDIGEDFVKECEMS